jgi:hypothetical protein
VRIKLQGHGGTWTPNWFEIQAEKDPEDAAASVSVEPTSVVGPVMTAGNVRPPPGDTRFTVCPK